jgi:hypothetical protein
MQLAPRATVWVGFAHTDSCLSGNVYTLLVRKYAKYLEEKVSVLRLVGFQFEKNRDACKDLSDKDAFKRVPKLQSQLNALLNCKMRTQHIGKNLLLIHTYMLLLKDSLVLYPILNDGVIGLIDRCFKMRKKEAQRVLEIYTLFVKETDALIALYDVSRTFARHLPDIHRVRRWPLMRVSSDVVFLTYPYISRPRQR